MLSWKTCLFAAILLLLCSSPVVSSSAVEEDYLDEDDFEDEDFLSSTTGGHRDLASTRIKPAWFDRVKADDTTGLLKACAKKQPIGPEHGKRCSKSKKICMFGNQECPDVGPHPEKLCYCDGSEGTQTWTCTEETCPIITADASSAECPSLNLDEPRCPPELPEFGASCQMDGLKCNYGNEKCCGICTKEHACQCDFISWFCLKQWDLTCDRTWYGPHTACKDHSFAWLRGQSCEEATAAILEEFPPMTVVCENESADPKITGNDENRFVVYTNSTGAATQVFFNRKAECDSNNRTCEFGGQTCDFSTDKSGSCWRDDYCTCQGAGLNMDCLTSTTCI